MPTLRGYRARVEAGLCPDGLCPNPPAPGKRRCERHLRKYREAARRQAARRVCRGTSGFVRVESGHQIPIRCKAPSLRPGGLCADCEARVEAPLKAPRNGTFAGVSRDEMLAELREHGRAAPPERGPGGAHPRNTLKDNDQDKTIPTLLLTH